jgi:hypothetical protein
MIAPVAEARVAANRTTGSRWAVLAHPGFTGSVFVLALNDQALKDRWPGLITGKLSDIAGVVMVAILLSALTRSARVGLIITAVAFTALKLLPGVAELATPVLGGVTRRDPIDLVALLILIPLVRGNRWPAGTRPERVEERSRPLIDSWRVGLQGLGLAAAVMATSATSCYEPQGVSNVIVGDGRLWAAIDVEEQPASWVTSDDAGQTWTYELGEAPSLESNPPLTKVCVSAGECFRVVDEDHVEQQSDSDWKLAYGFTPEQWKRLDRTDNYRNGCGLASARFNSIATASTESGDIVVVGMGGDGVLIRSQTGTWERSAVLDITPAKFGGPLWFERLQAAPLALIALAVVLLIGRSRKPSKHLLAGSIVSAVGVVVAAAAFVLTIFIDSRTRGLLIALLSAIAFALACGVALINRNPTLPQDRVGQWGPPGERPPPGSPLPPSVS